MFNRVTTRIFNYMGLGWAHYTWSLRLAYKKAEKEFNNVSVNFTPPHWKLVKNETVRLNKTIWVYWDNGYEDAPDIVKCCLKSINENKSDYDLVFLSDRNLEEYVNLPDYIYDKKDRGLIGKALFSDLIRIQLLIQYGGCWMDSTCLLTQTIPNIIQKSDLFMFSTLDWENNLTPLKCSNWFIIAKNDNRLLVMLRNSLLHYWHLNNSVFHYFIFHYFFSIIVERDEYSSTLWESKPFMNNTTPHVLQKSLGNLFDEGLYNHLLQQSFVHKLTYRYDKRLLYSKERNNLQQILNNYK